MSVGDPGVVESLGRFVEPRSLYLKQLEERCSEEAVRAVATESQIHGPRDATWKRLSATFSPLPEWPDPEAAPWSGWADWVVEFESPASSEAAGKAW